MTDAARITRVQLLRWRLRAQLLAGARPEGAEAPAQVVGQLLAVQAQDFGGARHALGARMERARLAEVTQALDAGTIVRSWPMRGTLHFVLPADLRWMLQITGPRMLAAQSARLARLGLDDRALGLARDTAIAALSGGRALGRRDFQAVLSEAGVPVTDERGYQAIFALAQQGLVCWGPTHRTQQALVLTDEWLPATEPVDDETALRRFALRFARGHGPVRVADFQWWTKCTVRQSRLAFELARDELAAVECDRETYWAPAGVDVGERTAPLPASDRFRALPSWDEYLNGPDYRRPAVTLERERLLVQPGNSYFQRSILDRGEVIAAWRPAGGAGSQARVAAGDVGHAFDVQGTPVAAESEHPLTTAQQNGAARALREWMRFDRG